MIRRALAWVRARFDTGEGRDPDEGQGGFVPSPLDRSVRDAHGGNDGGRRELAHIQEQAETLEEKRRDG
jgi:hypothetical protein